jgi:hypothetical protein
MALFKHPIVGFFTFDNHRVVHHVLNLSAPQYAIMTNPVPAWQTSGYDVFHETSTEIRALVFTDKPLDLRVSGAVDGRLAFCRNISNGVALYAMPLSLPAGRYVVKREGDWSGSVDFEIGETIERFWEIPYIMEASTAWTVVFVLSYIPALLLVIPFALPRAKCLENFIALKTRIAAWPQVFGKSLLVATIACIVIPFSLMPVENGVGFFFVIGNLFWSRFQWHYLGGKYGLCYLFCVFYPSVLLADAWVTGKGRFWAGVVGAVALRYFVYNYSWLVDMFGLLCAVTSPMMTFAPAWIFGHLLWFIFTKPRDKRTPDQVELLNGSMYKL